MEDIAIVVGCIVFGGPLLLGAVAAVWGLSVPDPGKVRKEKGVGSFPGRGGPGYMGPEEFERDDPKPPYVDYDD